MPRRAPSGPEELLALEKFSKCAARDFMPRFAPMTPREAITAAIKIFGSQQKLGEATGFTQTSVHHALRSGRPSVLMAVQIEKATGGQISAAELRPDIFDEPVFKRALAQAG